MQNDDAETMKAIGKRIRIASFEHDLNQAQLAELLGTSSQYVSKLEAGKINVGAITLARLAKVLHKPVSYFFEPFEEAESLPKAERAGASPKKRKAA